MKDIREGKCLELFFIDVGENKNGYRELDVFGFINGEI